MAPCKCLICLLMACMLLSMHYSEKWGEAYSNLLLTLSSFKSRGGGRPGYIHLYSVPCLYPNSMSSECRAGSIYVSLTNPDCITLIFSRFPWDWTVNLIPPTLGMTHKKMEPDWQSCVGPRTLSVLMCGTHPIHPHWLCLGNMGPTRRIAEY